MADANITVRIYFKTDNGPAAVGLYRLTSERLKQLRTDFTNHITARQISGAAYDCEVLRPDTFEYVPTVLILRFADILYIG